MKVPREDMIDRKLELVVDKLENKVLSMDNSILQLQETVNRNYDVADCRPKRTFVPYSADT